VIDFLVNAGSDSEESRTGDREWLAKRRREGVEEGGESGRGGWSLHGMIVQQSGEIICKGGGDF